MPAIDIGTIERLYSRAMARQERRSGPALDDDKDEAAQGPFRRRAPLLLSILAVLACFFVRVLSTEPISAKRDYILYGEYLVHGFAAPNSYHLPIANVVAGLVDHWGLPEASLAAVHALILALLLLAVEGELASGFEAWTAAAVVELLPWEYPQNVLTLLVVIVAGLAVWRAREESFWRTFVLASAVGTSLLFRSTLAFLPPALALCDGLPRFSALKRPARINVLTILFVPYLFLAPWITMNWAAHRRIIPFEDGEAACNVVTGALGLVEIIRGPWADGPMDALMRGDPAPPGSRTNGGVLMWAVRETGAHPLRFAFACAARAGLAIRWLFPYSLLAVWAFWKRRERREFQALALLSAYLLAIHCLMPVQKAYFAPLLPLLVILSASLLPPRPALSRPASRRILGAASALILALAAYTVPLFASPPMSAGALDRGIERDPRDAWLLTRRGAERIARGDESGAAADLSRASVLRPGDAETETLLAGVAMDRGDPARALALLSSTALDLQDRLRLSLIRADALLKAGHPSAALTVMQGALNKWIATCVASGVRNDGSGNALDPLLKSEPDEFLHLAEESLQFLPHVDRGAMLSLLTRLMPDSPQAWINRAEAPNRLDRESALSSLARAARLTPGREQRWRIANAYERLGEPGLALRQLDVLPEDADVLIAKARTLAQLGRMASAASALDKALAMSPDGAHDYEGALIDQELHKYGDALVLLRRLIRDDPLNPDLLNTLGVCQYLSGSADAAVATLKDAVRSNPGFLPAVLTLGAIDTDRKRYPEALALYEAALSKTQDRAADPIRLQLARTYRWLKKEREPKAPLRGR